MAKIALIGSAPSSMGLAPYGDQGWKIWACSPGTYHQLPRCDAFFEVHRWEPGVIGKPATQKQWFSPEYVAWMGMQPLVWMDEPVPEIQNSKSLPFDRLNKRWGSYFWTSSLAYMLAMALDIIIDERKQRAASGMSKEDCEKLALEDTIGLWGVDMAANEEYGYQRAGCQHFLTEANRLGIGILVPPESDLLRPMPPYGLFESTHFHIKNLTRQNELQGRLQQAEGSMAALRDHIHFLKGAIDNQKYHMDTWGDDRQGMAADPEIAKLQAQPIADLVVQVPQAVATLASAESVAGATVVAIRPAPEQEPTQGAAEGG